MIIKELFSAIAKQLKLPIWQIQALNRQDLNTSLERVHLPAMAWLFEQRFTMQSDLQGSQIFNRYNTAVYFLARPADDAPESIIECEKQLTELARQFRQLMQKQGAYTNVPTNGAFSPSVRCNYPQFDGRTMVAEVSFDVLLDMDLDVCAP